MAKENTPKAASTPISQRAANQPIQRATAGQRASIPANQPKLQFAFGRKNYMYLGLGLLLMIIGYLLLSGGGSKDPNVFNPELFSTQRMVTAPIILLLGFLTVAFAIMYHPKEKESQ